jgi:hypothetical protein
MVYKHYMLIGDIKVGNISPCWLNVKILFLGCENQFKKAEELNFSQSTTSIAIDILSTG